MSANPLDFSTYTPDWARPAASPPSGLDGPESIIAKIEQAAGHKLSEAERAQVIADIRNGGKFDIAVPEATANPLDFSSYKPEWATEEPTTAPAPAQAVAPTAAPVIPQKAEEKGWVQRAQDAVAADVNKAVDYWGAALDAVQGVTQKYMGQELSFDQNHTGGGLSRYIENMVNPIEFNLNDPEHQKQILAERASGLIESGTANEQAVQAYKKKEGLGEGFSGGVRGIGLDVMSNPDMALTSTAAMIPGVGTTLAKGLAYVPARRVFLNDYFNQVDQGVPEDEAIIHASAQAGIELTAEMIPGMKAGKAVLPAITSTFRKIVKEGGKEFLQEAGTEAAQTGLENLITATGVGSEETQKAAEKAGFKDTADFAERVAYAGTIGSVAAGGMSAPMAHLQTVAEQAAWLEEAARKSGKLSLDTYLQAQDKMLKEDVEAGMDAVDEAASIDKEQQKERDFANNAPVYSAEQKAAEEEAAFRTIERQRTADQLAQNPALKVAPIEPVSPEEVQKEWQSQADAEAARVQRVELGQVTERVRSRQELARKASEAEAAAKADSARKAEVANKRLKTIHENKITDQVIAENPGMDAADLAPKVKAALDANPFVAPQKAAETAPAAPAPVQPKKPAKAPAPAPAATGPVKTGTQSEIDALSAQLGLAPKPPESLKMKTPESKTAPDGQLDPESFAGRHLRVLKALSQRISKPAQGARDMVINDKVIFAPNPESIGREAHTDAAEFDRGEGKMYVYTDYMDPDNVVDSMIRILHEGTHGGQTSDRAGRSNVYQSMMSEDENSRAAQVIRKAAEKGHKLAQNAVDLARKAATDENGKVNKAVETLELVPYFVGEVVGKREGTIVGSLGGVVRDIRAAARNTVRKATGMDLDITLNDLHAAAAGVGEEIAKTDIKPLAGEGSVKMIGGKRGEGFDNAKKYRGVIDNKERYEFSDRDATLKEDLDAWDSLDEGKTVKLSDILQHSELYKNYPEAADIKVRFEPLLMGTPTEASFSEDENEIALNPAMMKETERVTSNLLHEVQHWVQNQEGFTAGSNPAYFKSKAVQGDVERAKDKFDKVIKEFDLGHAIRTLPPQARKMYEADVERRSKLKGWLSTGEQAEAEVFLRDGWAGRSTDRSIVRYLDRYQDAISNLIIANTAMREAEDKAFEIYKRDEGEVEARNTQRRMRMSDAAREANPPLSTYDVKPENVLDTAKYIGKPQFVPQSLKMRNPEKVTNTPQFKAWFKDSKVVDQNGNPRVMFHGTRSGIDFDVWRNDPMRDLGMHFGTVGQANHPRFVGHESEFHDENRQNYHVMPARIIPVYLSIQNPLRMEDVFGGMGANSLEALKKAIKLPAETEEKLRNLLPVKNEYNITIAGGDRSEYVREFQKAIQAAGYDGIVYTNVQEPSYVEYGVDEDGNEDPYKITDIQYDDSYIVFEPEQIKSAVGNSGEFSSTNPSILKMANPKGGPELPFTRKIPPVVSAFLSSSAGSGKIAREIIEHAIASPAGERMIAEGTVGQYRDGIRQLAKQRGVSEAVINREIAAKLDAIDKREDDYDTNLAAFKEVVSQYGKAGDALLKFRNQADNLTFQMIRERAAQGTPLSGAELETYTTMRNNLGRYAHRQYASHMGKGGKKYAKEIFKDYQKYLKENGDVSEKVKNNWKRVADAVKVIVDDHLMIPSDEELMEYTPTDVKRLFDVWGGKSNPEAYSLSQMRSILSDVRDSVNGDSDVMTATAENIVRDIIGLVAPKSPIAKSFRGGKIDKSILKERAWITPEIRTVMGEIVDPAMRLFSTVAKQTEFIARSRMLLELRDNVEGAHLQPPGASGRPEVKGMEELVGEEYGPLNHYFVSKNLANLLSSHVQQLATFEQAVAMAITRPTALGTLAASGLVQGWGNVAGKAKMLQIVGKPINFLINFMGGPRSMVMNGNMNPMHLLKAMNTAGHIIAYSIDPSKSSEEARRVTTVGITDSAFVGEINSEVYHELNKLLKEMQGKPPNKILEALNKWVILAPKETYAMMDVVYKIANFYQQADAILPAYYKAEGIDKTQAQIDREAADIVNGTNVTYKRAAPVVKNLERYGITQFGTFFYEVFRSEVNNVKQGFAELKRAKDSKTKKGKEIMAMAGARRLAGQATVWTLTGIASKILAGLVFGDDDDREEKLRALLPDYLQNQDFVIFGKDKDGKDVLFDWSRVDPAGPITDIMRTALNQDGDLDRLAKDFIDLYVAPRLGTRIVEAVAATGGRSKKMQDPLVQEKFPDTFESILNATSKIGLSDNAVKAWALVGETFLPGIVAGWGDSNARPVMKDGPSVVGALATYGGARMYTLDNTRALNSASFDHNGVLKDNRAEISQFFDNHPNATLERVVDELAEKRDQEKESFDRLQDVYDGMREVGHSHGEIAALLKKNHISAQTISDLKKGVFHFHSLSKKSIKGFRTNELVGKTLEEKRKINEKWKNAGLLLNAAEDELDEEN